jgi:outer membrane receptor protein involved in Fe transport
VACVLALVLPAVALGQDAAEADPNVPAARTSEPVQDEPGDVFTVGEIVVTDRRPANIEQAGTTTTLTGEQVGRRGDKTLDQTVEHVPGMQVYTHNKGHTRLRLRGFDQDYVVVLIDGIPMNDVYSTDLDLTSIPVMNVAKVVVNRGVSSALYGTDGAVGSINVVTRKPAELFAAARAEWGLYNNGIYNLAHGAPLGHFYYWLTGTIVTSDGFVPSAKLDAAKRREWFDRIIRYELYGKTFEELGFPAKDQYLNDTGRVDHSRMDDYNVAAKAGYAFMPGWEAGVSSAFFYREGETNTYEPGCMSDYNMAQEKWRVNRRPNFTGDQTAVKDFALRNRAFVWPEVWRVTASPYLDGHVGDFSVRLAPFFFYGHARQVGYGDTDHHLTKGYTALFTDRKDPNAYDPFWDIKNYGSYGFRLLPSYKLGAHRLSMGIHWRNDLFMEKGQALSANKSPNITALVGTSAYDASDLSAQRLSLALEYESYLFERLKLSAGVSYDAQILGDFRIRSGMDYTSHYVAADESMILGTRDSFNPVAGIVFEPVKDLLLLRAAGSIKTRFPTLGDYDKVTEESLDQDLRPERSYNANAGLEFLLFERAFSIRADYFHSTVDDRIAKLSSEEPPVNIKRLTTHGVETILTGRLPLMFRVFDMAASVSHTYVRARNLDDSPEESVNMGDLVAFTPEHQLSLDVHLHFVTGTALDVFATYLTGARTYVMAEAPEEFAPYDTSYFTTVALNDPFMLTLKLSQTFLDHFDVYVLARNVLDDYGMDPFNPGAGRMFYGGAEARW